MANYLICDNCQHKNTVNSERVVFCKSCDKKLANNYLDWKKSKFDSSFETYIAKETTENSESIKTTNTINKEKKHIFNRVNMFTGSNTSSELKIFIGSTIVQLILFFILINNSFSGTYTASNETNSYLKDVKWGTYPITQTLSISMPFELKDSESVLPGYMEHYISNHQSSKAESSESFSLTIEKMEFDDVYKIQNSDLISINDAYMKSPGVTKVKEEGLHTEINGYKTYVEYGSYTLNGKEYLYENYTLTKDDEGVKIILSYLKDDHLLSKYANIVSQSLLINKQVI